MKKLIASLILAILIPSFLLSSETLDSNRTSSLKNVNVFLVGTGVVGSALLEQLNQNHEMLRKQFGINIRIVGIANSHHMYMNPSGIDLMKWRSSLEHAKEHMSWENYLDLISHSNLSNVVFVDCSSNQTIADSYPDLLRSGISIVTPNKKANSGSFASYQVLHDLATHSHAKFF